MALLRDWQATMRVLLRLTRNTLPPQKWKTHLHLVVNRRNSARAFTLVSSRLYFRYFTIFFSPLRNNALKKKTNYDANVAVFLFC